MLHPVERSADCSELEHTHLFKPGTSNGHCGLARLLRVLRRKSGGCEGMIGSYGADLLRGAAHDGECVILGNRGIGETEASKHSTFDIWLVPVLHAP